MTSLHEMLTEANGKDAIADSIGAVLTDGVLREGMPDPVDRLERAAQITPGADTILTPSVMADAEEAVNAARQDLILEGYSPGRQNAIQEDLVQDVIDDSLSQ